MADSLLAFCVEFPPLYRTIWKHGDSEYLVCVERAGIGFGGEVHYVAVFDQDLKFFRGGEIRIHGRGEPYGLFEAFTSLNKVPEPLRNRWLLVVATWNPDKGFDERRPVVLNRQETEEDAEFNILSDYPVQWWDEKEYLSALPHDSVSVRWAEPGKSPSQFENPVDGR